MKDDCGESSPIPSGSQSTKSTPSTRQESKDAQEATGSLEKYIGELRFDHENKPEKLRFDA